MDCNITCLEAWPPIPAEYQGELVIGTAGTTSVGEPIEAHIMAPNGNNVIVDSQIEIDGLIRLDITQDESCRLMPSCFFEGCYKMQFFYSNTGQPVTITDTNGLTAECFLIQIDKICQKEGENSIIFVLKENLPCGCFVECSCGCKGIENE